MKLTHIENLSDINKATLAIELKSKVKLPTSENDYHRFKRDMGEIDFELGFISKEEFFDLTRNAVGEEMNNKFNAGFKDFR